MMHYTCKLRLLHHANNLLPEILSLALRLATHKGRIVVVALGFRLFCQTTTSECESGLQKLTDTAILLLQRFRQNILCRMQARVS